MTITRRAATLLLPFAVAACSSGEEPADTQVPAAQPAAVSPSASPTGEPKTYDAVKAAVNRIEAAAAAKDGATRWDMLTATGQATMTRDDYARVVRECPRFASSPTVLSIALNAGGSSATVTSAAPAEQGGGSYTWQMVYEGGRWRHQPSDAAMKWMTLGADKALTVLRNDGVC